MRAAQLEAVPAMNPMLADEEKRSARWVKMLAPAASRLPAVSAPSCGASRGGGAVTTRQTSRRCLRPHRARSTTAQCSISRPRTLRQSSRRAIANVVPERPLAPFRIAQRSRPQHAVHTSWTARAVTHRHPESDGCPPSSPGPVHTCAAHIRRECSRGSHLEAGRGLPATLYARRDHCEHAVNFQQPDLFPWHFR